METAKAYELLRRSRHRLTKQQYRTLSGQIRAGEAEAAVKGLETIIKRNLRKDAV